MAVGAMALHIPGNSPGGAKCAVKAPGGEPQSDFVGGTDDPYDSGREDPCRLRG